MREYLQAIGIVVGGLIVIGLLAIFVPVIAGVLSVIWPVLIIPILVVIVAEYLKSKRS